MSVLMAEKKQNRLRLSFDADSEVTRRAVHIAAALQGCSHSDVINNLIKEHLQEAIELAKKAIEDDEPRPRRKGQG